RRLRLRIERSAHGVARAEERPAAADARHGAAAYLAEQRAVVELGSGGALGLGDRADGSARVARAEEQQVLVVAGQLRIGGLVAEPRLHVAVQVELAERAARKRA